MSNEKDSSKYIYFGAGVVAGVGGFYVFIKIVVLPRLQKAVEDGVTIRVQSIIRDNTGIDPSRLEPMIRREVSLPISTAVVQAL